MVYCVPTMQAWQLREPSKEGRPWVNRVGSHAPFKVTSVIFIMTGLHCNVSQTVARIAAREDEAFHRFKVSLVWAYSSHP